MLYDIRVRGEDGNYTVENNVSDADLDRRLAHWIDEYETYSDGGQSVYYIESRSLSGPYLFSWY